MKLTKEQTKLHDEALALVDRSGLLTEPEKHFVLEHYHPGAAHNIGKGGIFFTPHDIADCAAMFHQGGGRIVDACAGIGMLGYHLMAWGSDKKDLTCIEINPEFVRVGRKVLPEATWICGSVFDVLPKLGRFDSGISNPPFGRIPAVSGVAHMAVCDLLVKHTETGAIVIIPDTDHSMEDRRDHSTGRLPEVSSNYRRFRERNPDAGITPCSVDMGMYCKAWKGADPKVMICDLWKNQ